MERIIRLDAECAVPRTNALEFCYMHILRSVRTSVCPLVVADKLLGRAARLRQVQTLFGHRSGACERHQRSFNLDAVFFI